MENSKGSAQGRDGMPVVFREVQRFRYWLYWVPIVIVTVVVWWQFSEQILRGRPPGQEPIPDWTAWLLTILFGLGFPAFMALVCLVTEVTTDAIRVGLSPFRLRRIPLHSIDTAMEREYSAMKEFGGWGVRWSKHGRAYNASGDKGVQLVLKDGSRILIGTQKPGELVSALSSGGIKIIR